MPTSVPPRPSTTPHRFVIGRDGEGHWIARDEQGQTGGVFADKVSAIRFATMESDHQAGAIRFASRSMHLSLFN